MLSCNGGKYDTGRELPTEVPPAHVPRGNESVVVLGEKPIKAMITSLNVPLTNLDDATSGLVWLQHLPGGYPGAWRRSSSSEDKAQEDAVQCT
jgi:hypothetical protein